MAHPSATSQGKDSSGHRDEGICIVHLVRKANGTQPLEAFLRSYHAFAAGVGHDLVLLLKGFASDTLDRDFEECLRDTKHQRLHVGDWGYDITAYFRAVKTLPRYGHFCFLNSFSEILAGDWLLKLHAAVTMPGAGVAAATGSYQGFHRDWRGIPDRRKFSMRSGWKQSLLDIGWVESCNEAVNRLLAPAYPNPHVRTNGFIIERDVMLKLRPQFTPTKRLSYGFESGWNSLTRQVKGMGKSAFVVGRDGTAYDIDRWRDSDTFWQDDQRNLLIADKQTKRYEQADASTREVFRRYAWGP